MFLRNRAVVSGAVLCAAGLLLLLPAVGCGGGDDTPSPTPSSSATPPPQDDMAARLQAALNRVRAKYKLPALAGAVVRADGSPITAAVGIRREGASATITTSDRFNIGSCGKAMTGTLIGLLVSEGKLRYEATLLELFPEIAADLNPAYRTVTLGQVLRMQAGLPAYTAPEDILALPPFTGNATQQREQFAAYLLKRAPAHTPGTEHYSNASYVLAALVAERAMGRDWQSLMREKVYTPLGMNGVAYGPAAKGDRSGQPWGHLILSGSSWTPRDPEEDIDEPALYPAGDQNMTVADWTRFAQAHLRGLEGRTTGLPLTSAVFRQMHDGPHGETTVGAWVRSTEGGNPSSVFRGATDGFDAVVSIQPEKDLAVVLVTNAYDETENRSSTVVMLAEALAEIVR